MKAARPAAPCATHCYPAIARLPANPLLVDRAAVFNVAYRSMVVDHQSACGKSRYSFCDESADRLVLNSGAKVKNTMLAIAKTVSYTHLTLPTILLV